MARTVLLADDSVTAQNMGRRILTDAGYEVITVNNGSAALKKIHESRPDLIVLDVYMPGYGGLEVCQRLKESDATMKIPVLLTVGKMEPFKTDEAKRVRADGHIVKPFDASELLAALTKLEDKIVPKSEGWRFRGKDSKKSKARAHDPAADFDDSHTEQISYLKQERNREAAIPAPEAPVEAAPKAEAITAVPETKAQNSRTERPADPFAGRDSQIPTSIEEPTAEPVTFAAGPIFEPQAQATVGTTAELEAQGYAEAEREPEREERAEVEFSVPENSEPVTPQAFEPDTAQPAVSSQDTAVSESEPEAVPKAEGGPRWVAENVTVSAEEASRSLDEEMREAQTAEATANGEVRQEVEPPIEKAPSISSAPETDSQSGAAFAAAASAGPSSQVEAISSSTSDAPAENSKATPAWEGWQRMRDSVVTRDATEAIAESVAHMAQENVAAAEEEPSRAPAEVSSEHAEAPAVQSSTGGDALSSIVDNVLAELKPRLMAEIAKQLAGDKK
ncbi:MAG TPA: response regulator [Terriglobales bacterium]